MPPSTKPGCKPISKPRTDLEPLSTPDIEGCLGQRASLSRLASSTFSGKRLELLLNPHCIHAPAVNPNPIIARHRLPFFERLRINPRPAGREQSVSACHPFQWKIRVPRVNH